MYMDNYIGKHLLVDCYGCRPSSIDSSPDLLAAMIDAAEKNRNDIKRKLLP